MANEKEIGRLVIRLVAEVGELKKQLQSATAEVKTHVTQTKGLLGEMRTSFLDASAKVYVAWQTLKKAIEFAEIGARAQQVEESFRLMTRSMGVDGDQLITDMKKVGRVFAEETGLMTRAMRLLVEGVSPEDIVGLMEASVVASRKMGVSVQDAFDRVSEALIRLQTRGLKSAFPMDQEAILRGYAKALGGASEHLTETQKRQALLNEVLRQSKELIEVFGGTIKPEAIDTIDLFKSSVDELKESLSKDFVSAFKGAGQIISEYMIPKTEEYRRLLLDIVELIKWELTPLWFQWLVKKGEGKKEGRAVFTIEEGMPEIGEKSPWSEKRQEEIDKLLQTYKGRTLTTTVEIAKAQAEIEKTAAIRAAIERGESIEYIERQYSIRGIQERLKAEIEANAEDQKMAVLEAGQKGILTKEVRSAIDREYETKRRSFVQKTEDEITKIQLDEAKFRAEEISKALLLLPIEFPEDWEMSAKKKLIDIQKFQVDSAISTKELILAQFEDLYGKGQMTVFDFYGEKIQIFQDILSLEIEQMEKEKELAYLSNDTVKAKEIESEIDRKRNEFAKKLLGLTNERLSSYDKEIQRLNAISQTERERRSIRIDELRGQLRITEAESLAEKIRLEEQYLVSLQFELSENDRLTKEQQDRYAQLQIMIAQTYAKISTLNQGLAEQTGSFFDGMGRGWKELKDTMITEYRAGAEFVKGTTRSIGDTFEEMLQDSMMGELKSFEDYWKSLWKSLVSIFAKAVRQMVETWVTDFLKQISGSTTTQGAGGKGLVNTVISLLGGLVGSISGLFKPTSTTSTSPTSSAAPIRVPNTPSSYYAQAGGSVKGPSGIDAVSARLTAGEYVHPVASVNYYGESVMEAIRQMVIPRDFFSSILRGSGPEFQHGGPVSNTVNVPVNISDPRVASHLRSGIEDVVVEILREHSR